MSRKIALIQPRITTGKSLGIKKSPESIQSLAGQLHRDGHDVRMFHAEANDNPRRELEEYDPDIVGISTMTPNFPAGKKIAEEIKGIRKDITVVLGGWHISGCVQAYKSNQESETLREILNPNSPFDYGVIGEGDLVLPEIVRSIEENESAEELDGVAYFDGEEIRINTAKRIKNLDDLADPLWEGLPIDEYRDQRSGNLDLSVHFNRACRYKCGFCSTATVYGRGVSTFSPGRAVDYIEHLLEQFRPEVITLTDEDFFANLKWVEAIVALIKEKDFHGKYGVGFDTFASINDILRIKRSHSSDLLARMKGVGFNSFTVGVESLNLNTLRRYNKELMILQTMAKEERELYKASSPEVQDEMFVDQHLKSAQEAIDFAHGNGILIVGDYILGNLGETEQEVRDGFGKFSNLKNLHIAYIPTYTPFPGTQLWKEAYDSGKIARTPDGNIDWSRFDASEGALDLGYDIGKLRDELEVQFYTSERYKRDMMAELERRPEMLDLFMGRFNYLNTVFGDNKLVQKRLEELKKFESSNEE